MRATTTKATTTTTTGGPTRARQATDRRDLFGATPASSRPDRRIPTPGERHPRWIEAEASSRGALAHQAAARRALRRRAAAQRSRARRAAARLQAPGLPQPPIPIRVLPNVRSAERSAPADALPRQSRGIPRPTPRRPVRPVRAAGAFPERKPGSRGGTVTGGRRGERPSGPHRVPLDTRGRRRPPLRLTRRGRVVLAFTVLILALGIFWLGTRAAALTSAAQPESLASPHVTAVHSGPH